MTVELDKLTRKEPYEGCDFVGYKLEEIKSLPGEVGELDFCAKHWLWVYDNDGHVEFALLDFVTAIDQDDVYVNHIFRGYGFSKGLREMRHIWWGDKDGYTFHLPAKAVIKAFRYLSRYFDLEA